MSVPALSSELVRRKLPGGGWSFVGFAQASLEATCLATLALAAEPRFDSGSAAAWLLRTQRKNGAWPAFVGDPGASWTTALAALTLNVLNESSAARTRALAWLLSMRGREGHWLWRWKFKTTDREARFDPDKFGWPWIPGSNSWVIPTAFSLIAIKQSTACLRSELAERRIRTGVEMLIDRACIGGGWNAGNNVVYGQPLVPHVEPTAIALLALQDEPRTAVVAQSLDWLRSRAREVQSVASLAWAILALFIYQEKIQQLQERLSMLVRDGTHIRNNATLAVAVLALKSGEAIHPFAVTR